MELQEQNELAQLEDLGGQGFEQANQYEGEEDHFNGDLQ
jgi:hypothetical protein